MKRYLLTLLLSVMAAASLIPVAFGAVDNHRFQEANAAYSRNDFPGAIALYEELVSNHGYSAPLLYNLANSYAQAGRTGKAVLNYERALQLDPHDPDILGNLQLVRTANGLFNPELTKMEQLLHLLSMNQWIALGSLAVVLLTVSLVLSLRFRLSRRVLTVLAVTCAAVMLASAIATLELHGEWTGSVVVEESRLLISPFDGAATAGNIPEGRIVYAGKEHGTYVYVEDETGRRGWIPQLAIEPVIPAKIER